MRLHTKTVGVLILVFLLLLCSALGFYFFYVLEDVLKIEHDAALGNASRVHEAFTSEQRQMRNVAADWAGWDDSFNAMQHMTQEFIDSWMAYESYQAMQISELVFFTQDRRPALALHVDSEREEVSRLPADAPLAAQLFSTRELFDFSADSSGVAFFDLLNGKPVIVASSPIQDGKRSKPARGTLVLVKYITDDMIKRIASQVKLDLVSRPLHSVPGRSSRRNTARLVDNEKIKVVVPVLGLQNRPVLSVEFFQPRPIYQQAWGTLQLFVAFWICASGAVLALAGFLINRFVIARLKEVSARLRDIHTTRRFDETLLVSGSDEISQMTADINAMLTALSESHYYEVLNARDKAQAASQAKTNFMAKVSHELRTPIHGILGMVGIMWRNSPDDQARLQLGMVRDSAIGLLGVVNDVLDFSRSEHSELSVTIEPCDVRTMVRKAMRVIGPRLFERSEHEPIDCIAEIAHSVPEIVLTDGKRLSQILVNFLANALKFTRSGSVHLTVGWRREDDTRGVLECTVHDTGIGIPAHKISDLFEPFRQLDDSVNRAYQGTGLGLAIVKQLVTALGGSVSVASEPERGSSFSCQIPVTLGPIQAVVPRTPVRGSKVWIAAGSRFEFEKIADAFSLAGADIHEVRGRYEKSAAEPVAEEFMVLSASLLGSERGWSTLDDFIGQHGADRVSVLVSAHQLTYRERLRAKGVQRMVLTPVVAQDVVRSIEGTYTEDFSGYDDYVDIVPDLRHSLDILIADDLMTNQIVLKCILQDMGHQVTVVSNGEELLDALGAMYGQRAARPTDRQFDIVMTDLQMPVMDGISALKRVREWEEQKKVAALPVFLVTAHALDSEREQMLRAGASAVVTKPIDIRKLEGAIREVVVAAHRV